MQSFSLLCHLPKGVGPRPEAPVVPKQEVLRAETLSLWNLGASGTQVAVSKTLSTLPQGYGPHTLAGL